MSTLVDRFINDQINGGVFKDGLPMLVSTRRKAEGRMALMLISADCVQELVTLLNVGVGYDALVKCDWFPYVEAESLEEALTALEIKLTKLERDAEEELYAWVQRVSDVQWAITNPLNEDIADTLEEMDLSNGHNFIREMYRTGYEVA